MWIPALLLVCAGVGLGPDVILTKTDMKNTFVYHLVVTLPILLFFYYWLENGKSAVDLIIFGIAYPFIFRPWMDYYRLKALRKIEKEDFWKMWKWGTFYRFKYYNTLMFGKE